jgi:hypothetical protein
MTWTDRILQALWTFFAGIILGWLTESYLIGGGLAAITRKIVFGDWDRGFQWSRSDIWFWSISFVEGAVGAAIGRYFRVQERVSQTVYDQVGVRVEEVPVTLLSELRVAELGVSV